MIVSFILSLSIISCGNAKQNFSDEKIEKAVALKLQEIDNNYSDETLKALSIILRGNFSFENQINIQNINQNSKYENIAKQTKNCVLKNNNGSIIKISLNLQKDYRWLKIIKKNELLEFALKNNINLANLSDIQIEKENDKVLGIKIANKYFDYANLSEEFNLESNLIEDISQTKSEIIIKGKNKGFYDNFDIYKSEELSNNNYNFEQILKYFFNNLKISKKSC